MKVTHPCRWNMFPHTLEWNNWFHWFTEIRESNIHPYAKVMTLDFFYRDIKGFISILQQYENLVMKLHMLTCCGINLICVSLSIIEIMVDILISSSPHTFQLFENTIHLTVITGTKYRLFYSVTMGRHCPNILGASNVIFRQSSLDILII